jgi:type III secretion protein C
MRQDFYGHFGDLNYRVPRNKFIVKAYVPDIFRKYKFVMRIRWRSFAVPSVTACLVVVLSHAVLARAPEPRWPVGTYAYLVPDQDIRTVLKDFGRQLRIPISFGDDIRGRLTGRLPPAEPRSFLDKLCARYGLVWYYDGATVHVANLDDRKTEIISLSAAAPADLSERMGALGLLDERFQLKLTPDRRSAIVSGPASYIAQVRQIMSAVVGQQGASTELRAAMADDPRVRVFRGGQAVR